MENSWITAECYCHVADPLFLLSFSRVFLAGMLLRKFKTGYCRHTETTGACLGLWPLPLCSLLFSISCMSLLPIQWCINWIVFQKGRFFLCAVNLVIMFVINSSTDRSRVRECKQNLKLEKQGKDSPLELPEGTEPYWQLDISLVRPVFRLLASRAIK